MILTAAFFSCADCEETMPGDHPEFMQVRVATLQASRGLHTGTSLGDGEQIGIFVRDVDGNHYDGVEQGYSNVCCTSDGEGSSQKWDFTTPVLFSSTPGKALAYYPWSEDVTDCTAIPLETASQTDYMSCGWVGGLSNAAPRCSFVLDHALTAIRLSVTRGSYSGPGMITDAVVQSPALATEGTLDATTGIVTFTEDTDDTGVTVLTGGTECLAESGAADGWEYEYMFVPTGNTGTISIRLKMDGQWYSTTANVASSQDGQDTFTTGMALASGTVYVISMRAENTALVAEGVSLSDWETVTGQGGNLTVE